MKHKTTGSLTVLLTAPCQEDATRSRPTSVPGCGGAAARSRKVRAGACAALVTAVHLTILVALLSAPGHASERISEWVGQIEIANSLVESGDLNEAQSDHEAATELYPRAINIAESRLGSAHPILGGLLQKYSEVLRRSGKRSEARTAAAAARRISEESSRENLTGHTTPIEALMVSK